MNKKILCINVAMTAMLSEYLSKLGVKKMLAHIAVGNLRFEKLAWKLGFVLSGDNGTDR